MERKEFLEVLAQRLAYGDAAGVHALVTTEAEGDPVRAALVEAALAAARGEAARSVAAAGRAYALAPEDPTVLQYVAMAHRTAGDLTTAETYARQAANRDPGTRSQLVLADILARQGRHAEAEEAYRAVLEWDPDCVPALNGAGLMRARQGDNARALLDFVRATMADPDDPVALQNVTQMYAQAGWAFGAMALARVTRDSGHHPPEVQAVLDLLLLQLATRVAQEFPQPALVEEADALVARLVDECGALPPSFQVRVARELQDVGRTDATREVAERLEDVPLPPKERAHVVFLEGLAAEADGDAEGAIEAYERALAADPERWEAACNAANLLLGDGTPAALARIPTLLDAVPAAVRMAAPQLLYNEATYLARSGQPDAARARLEHILTLTGGQGALADLARQALGPV